MGKRFKKSNSRVQCPGLNCLKMDSKIFKKKTTMLHSSIPDERPRKKKLDTSGGYYLRNLPVYSFFMLKLLDLALVSKKHIFALPFFGTKIPDWPWVELENYRFDPCQNSRV